MTSFLLPELLPNVDCTLYNNSQLEQIARSKLGPSDERVAAMKELMLRESFSPSVLTLIQATYESLCFPGRSRLLLFLASFLFHENRPSVADSNLTDRVLAELHEEKCAILVPLTLLVRAGLGDRTANVDAREILQNHASHILRDAGLSKLGNARLNSVLKSIASAIIAGKSRLPPLY